MKKVFLVISVLIAISTILKAQESKILGKISNPNSDMVYLSTAKEVDGKMKQVQLDSSKVAEDGSFNLKTTVNETTTCFFFDGSESTRVLLSAGDELGMTLNTKLFDETIVYSGKGAEKNNALKNISLFEESINNLFYSFPEDADTVEMFGFLDNMYVSYAAVVSDYKNEIADFNEFGQQLIEGVEDAKKEAKQAIIANKEFKKLVESLKGKEGLEIVGVNLDGKKVKLSEFKGKTIVIDFWATWCGPCKAEMPAFKALEEKYGADIHFLSIALWCEEEGWKKMATDLGFKNNIYLAKGEEKQIKDYSIKFIPRYIVLDKNFKIVDALAPRPSSGDLEKYF